MHMTPVGLRGFSPLRMLQRFRLFNNIPGNWDDDDEIIERGMPLLSTFSVIISE